MLLCYVLHSGSFQYVQALMQGCLKLFLHANATISSHGLLLKPYALCQCYTFHTLNYTQRSCFYQQSFYSKHCIALSKFLSSLYLWLPKAVIHAIASNYIQTMSRLPKAVHLKIHCLCLCCYGCYLRATNQNYLRNAVFITHVLCKRSLAISLMLKAVLDNNAKAGERR